MTDELLVLSFESPESSTIAGACYDPDTRQMKIDFKRLNPKTKKEELDPYLFTGIDAELWAQFLQATSKGRYFATRIRPMFAGKRLPQ